MTRPPRHGSVPVGRSLPDSAGTLHLLDVESGHVGAVTRAETDVGVAAAERAGRAHLLETLGLGFLLLLGRVFDVASGLHLADLLGDPLERAASLPRRDRLRARRQRFLVALAAAAAARRGTAAGQEADARVGAFAFALCVVRFGVEVVDAGDLEAFFDHAVGGGVES